MVGAIQKHIIAITKTFEAFFKGKFLLYFIPGAIIGLIYLFGYYLPSMRLHAAASATENIPWIGSLVAWSANGILSFFDTLVHEFYKFFILVLLSPVHCLLSEKFDSHLTGKAYNFSLLRFINDFLRMLLIVFTALTLEFVFLAIWFLLDFIFPSFIGETGFFIISAFFLGFSFYDYSLERNGITVIESWGFGFKKFASILITGILFSLCLELPIIGLIIAPVLATMISTSVYVQGSIKDPTSEN